MIYYIILLILVLIFKIFSTKIKGNSDKYFIISCTALLIFFSAFRAETVGADTDSYHYMFNNIKNISWSSILPNFFNSIFYKQRTNDVELGYILLVKLFQLFSQNYRVFLFFIALAFHIPFAIWVYKRSLNPCISYIIYICLYFTFYGTTGIRQTLTTVVALFFGYRFIENKKLLSFLLVIVLACTIHRSALALLPFYFICNIKMTRKMIVVSLLGAAVAYVIRFPIIRILGDSLGYSNYAEQYQGAGTPVFTFMMIAIAIVLWIFWDNINIAEKLDKGIYLNQTIVAFMTAIILSPLAYVDPSLLRIVHYYSINLVLLIPFIVNGFNPKEKAFVEFIACGAIIGLFLMTIPQFRFMWG